MCDKMVDFPKFGHKSSWTLLSKNGTGGYFLVSGSWTNLIMGQHMQAASILYLRFQQKLAILWKSLKVIISD